MVWHGIFLYEGEVAMPKVRFGIIADLHREIMHDAPQRLTAFIQAAREQNADFIVSLGDFCHSLEAHEDVRTIWNSFPGGRYLVLGNHDTDQSDKLTWMRFFGLRRIYDSFDWGGFHFCLLDTNTVSLEGIDYDYGNRNYFAFEDYRENLSASQLAWLKSDLAAAHGPTVLFSHASLADPNIGIRNRQQLREIVLDSRRQGPGVIAAFNGHNHVDGCLVQDGVPYIDVNSASNCWLGEAYACDTYGPQVECDHPWIRCTAPYRDALFTFVELDDQTRTLSISGMQSEFVGPTPQQRGHSGRSDHSGVPGGFAIRPVIEERILHY